MKLMRVGKWLEAKQGETLAVEKQPINAVMLIYNGLVGVETGGKEVAKLKDGNFIGEVSFITGRCHGDGLERRFDGRIDLAGR